MTPEEVNERLFREKSLGDVLETFEGSFARPIAAKKAFLATFLVMAIFSLWSFRSCIDDSEVQAMLSKLTGAGLALSSALLGVAIAGFSIFASSMDKEVLERLAASEKRKGVSNLSFIFSLFIYTLATLFYLLVTSCSYLFFLDSDSIVYEQLAMSPFGASGFAAFLQFTFLSLYSGQILFVFFILKSFTFNLHQTLLVVSGARIVEEHRRKLAPSGNE